MIQKQIISVMGPKVEIDPCLVEECVLLAMKRQSEPVQKSFRSRRDVLYGIEDSELRENQFQRFHSSWFERLGLGGSMISLLRKFPSVWQSVSRCLVVYAKDPKQEGADLHDVSENSTRARFSGLALVIRIQPATLLRAEKLKPLVLHELMHAADILDPEFGYERHWSAAGKETAPGRLLQSRYHAVWDVTIDGRLVAAGVLSRDVEELRRREFLETFRMLGSAAEESFRALFTARRPTHREIVHFISNPLSCSPRPDAANGRLERCSLCKFPTTGLVERIDELDPRIIERIQIDFRDWNPDLPICRQCADLYAAVAASAI